MLPQSQPRKKRNSSKVNLMISLAFHALLVIVMLYFAARSGLLGKQLKKITVTMEKEKPPVKPPEPPKVEPPKEMPKVEPPKAEAPKVEASPVVAPPVVAPPAAELPAFDFDGGKLVQSSSDPVQLYKGLVEYALRSKWSRPTDMADDNYVVEVEVSVSRDGQISDPQWEKSSGSTVWDDSVRQAIAATTSINRPPPTNFPPRITVRFDVQSEATEPILQ
jgi:TonB family protein